MPTETTQSTHDQRSLRASGGRKALIRLGNRLRAARLEAGLTQAQAAQYVGVTAQTIRNWETARNEPPPAAIQKLADRYKVSEDALLPDLTEILIPRRTAKRFPYDRVTVDGNKLSRARTNANLTQVEVSFMTGIHTRAIGRYEKNISNPPVTTLQVLASLYDRHAGSFTPKGHFSLEEQEIFDASTTIPQSRTSNKDPVLQAYTVSEPHLTESAKQRIANFIVFTFHQVTNTAPQGPDPDSAPPDATSQDYDQPATYVLDLDSIDTDPTSPNYEQKPTANPVILKRAIAPEATSADFDDQDDPDEPAS